MKKTVLAIALMSAGITTQAQSNITLYGRLDAGIEYINGLQTGSRWRAESGNWGTGLWGIKGSEEIGAGNQIVFHLEGSFDTMNGRGPGGSRFFNRWATLGFANDTYGTLLMGRELAIANGIWDFDPFGQSSWSTASLVRGRNWNQTSRNISYQSPQFHGFDIYGQYALSNATNWNGNGTTGQGRSAGLQLTYTTPLFQLRGLYDEARNPANGKLDDVFNYSREYFAGINVFTGPFEIQAAYQTAHADSSPFATHSITSTQQIWGGLTWRATPAAALIAAVYHVNANHGGGNANIYTVGGSYNLSKRTLLNMQIAAVCNSKNANFGLNANRAGTDPATGNPQPGGSQSGVYAGIQHLF